MPKCRISDRFLRPGMVWVATELMRWERGRKIERPGAWGGRSLSRSTLTLVVLLLVVGQACQMTGAPPPRASSAEMAEAHVATGTPENAARRIPRIGFLSPGLSNYPSPSKEAFQVGLRELGYIEGETVEVEYRFTEGNERMLPSLAEELVAAEVDVIVALGVTRVQAARAATSSIPIVMASVSDAVQAGLVSNLARPDANVTGVTTFSSTLAAKRMEILKQAMPSLTRVAVLATPRVSDPDSSTHLAWEGTSEAARILGIELVLIQAQNQSSVEQTQQAIARAIAEAVESGAQAVVPLPDALYDVYRPEVAEYSLAAGLPTIYARSDFVDDAGLLSYGADLPETFRRVAVYADRLIKGAKPEELPVEQSSGFELAVNLRTAQQLGLEIPASILRQAPKIVR
jgi:putative tryptophan/tyrosine transport system substrate-binding protein